MSPTGTRSRTWRRRFAIQIARIARWLHIYLSMLSLAIVLFFSVTGITLNHPDWVFGEVERIDQAEGQIKGEWLHAAVMPTVGSTDPADPARAVAKLEVVEHLRARHGVRGALTDFRVDDRECLVAFKGPGYSADAFIDRETGHYNLTQTRHGAIAILNDLHKGRDTGPVWSVVIDVSAALMTVVSLSGLVLLLYLKLRRIPGLVVALVGAIAAFILYRCWVP